MDTLKTSPGREDRALDKTDRRILRVLQSDGRISNLKLAEAVHLLSLIHISEPTRPY